LRSGAGFGGPFWHPCEGFSGFGGPPCSGSGFGWPCGGFGAFQPPQGYGFNPFGRFGGGW
jgi:hypothetical protein